MEDTQKVMQPEVKGDDDDEQEKHYDSVQKVENDTLKESADFQRTFVGDHGRAGLSSAEAEKLYDEVGYNELKHVEIS